MCYATPMERTHHALGFCSMCGLTVLCGRCGNNMCNGGHGEKGRCPDCPSAYERLENLGEPVLFAAVLAKREDIRAWRTRQIESLAEADGASDPKWLVAQVIEVADRAFDDLTELERALSAEANQVVAPD